jgi:hypothetical protein
MSSLPLDSAQLDALINSNPTDDVLEYLKKGDYQSTVDYCKKIPFPRTSTPACKDEIRELILLRNDPEMNEMTKKSNFMHLDADPVESITFMVMKFMPEDTDRQMISSLISDISEQVKPVALRIKYHFNRPRPSVAAAYHKAPLFAHCSASSAHPSYPSYGVMLAKSVAIVISSRYPHLTQDMDDMVHYVWMGKKTLGLNYHSDCELSLIASEMISKDEKFTSRYVI